MFSFISYLSDITTHRGLKKAFVDFNTIYRSLEGYLTSMDDRIAGAAASVLAKMAVDGKIGDLLFQRGEALFLRLMRYTPYW